MGCGHRAPCCAVASERYSTQMVCASRPAARLLRTAAPFELPGWYFGTTRPIIRLVVDLIIRVVLYYQPKADNPADNPAVSFVV